MMTCATIVMRCPAVFPSGTVAPLQRLDVFNADPNGNKISILLTSLAKAPQRYESPSLGKYPSQSDAKRDTNSCSC